MEIAVDIIELVNYDRQHFVFLTGSVSLLEGPKVPEDYVASLPPWTIISVDLVDRITVSVYANMLRCAFWVYYMLPQYGLNG